MLISYRHKFIFIHIYKVAGTSIRKALWPYAYDPAGFLLRKILRRLSVHRIVRHPWLTEFYYHASALDARNGLTPRMFNRSFKFAFVRNPWDWQVSLYMFTRRTPTHPQNGLMKRLGSFSNYIRWRVTEDRHLQQDFIIDEKGRVLVDFVGKYENLRQDFRMLCGQLGLKCNLPHLNRSSRKHYREYYTPATVDLVAEAFREDIERFGYEF